MVCREEVSRINSGFHRDLVKIWTNILENVKTFSSPNVPRSSGNDCFGKVASCSAIDVASELISKSKLIKKRKTQT